MAEESGRRKRRRPTSNLASMIAVENATVPIQFLEGQKKTYQLRWEELLTVEGEVPFENYEELQVGTPVLAPWCDKDGDIDFSEAVVVDLQSTSAGSATKKKCTDKESSTSASKKKTTTVRKKCGTPKKKSKEKAQACASKKVNSTLLLEVTKSGDNPGSDSKSDEVQSEDSSCTLGTEPTQPRVTNLGQSGEASIPASAPLNEGSTSNTDNTKTKEDPSLSMTKLTPPKSTQEAATYLSESMSVLNATEFPDCSLEHSDFESSIMDQASMSDGMVSSNLPHSTHYHQALDSNSGALSPTLSLPLSLSKGDPCVYGGHYDRSQSMPPNNHRSQQESTYFHTPTIHKRPHLQRRFTYPPTPGYSLCTPTSDLDCTPYHSEDELSSFSGLSSISQRNRHPTDFRYMSPVPSPDLQFVYMHWISPLKEQLADVQKELRNILTNTTSSPYNHPGAAMSVNIPGPPVINVHNAVDDDLGSDDVTKDSNNGPGVYLGYPNREKYQYWVADLTQNELDTAERSSTDYIDLGKKLLQLLFSQELSEPDKYCCTKSDGKQLLNQLKLQGMRYHLHRKFCSKKGVKMYSSEEEELWDKCLKKMNARIRYERTLVKKGKN